MLIYRGSLYILSTNPFSFMSHKKSLPVCGLYFHFFIRVSLDIYLGYQRTFSFNRLWHVQSLKLYRECGSYHLSILIGSCVFCLLKYLHCLWTTADLCYFILGCLNTVSARFMLLFRFFDIIEFNASCLNLNT